jgi:hypothetical protein
MTKRKANPAQLDLFEWAAKRPTAKMLDALPGIARRLWRERAMRQPNNPDTPILPLRRRA